MKVSHLLYMDDSMLIGKREELQKQMQVVGTFSQDIHMFYPVRSQWGMYHGFFFLVACSITRSNTTCLIVIFTITEFRTVTLIVAHYEVCLTCLG
jgi:hypothetical protein